VRTAAILPVKSFARAKQRLGGAVAPGVREALAQAMACDVLDVLVSTPGLEVLVVTAEPAVAERARTVGATVVHDPSETGQSAAALLGITAARARGAERVLLVPGDCPAMDPGDLAELLAVGDVPVVIVPDRHGTGTNALLLSPPDAIVPAFGSDSRRRHEALARAAGVAPRVLELPSLAHDIDTPADLAALDPAAAGNRTRARLQPHAA
jgi:2-phospho-L-lactate guanylyltransferase